MGLLVTIGCKIDGKARALVLRRQGSIIKGLIYNQHATDVDQAIKDGIKVDFADGETLHTALHALGVWTWGASDGDP